METVSPPKPRQAFYVLGCMNQDCNAILRCREDELEFKPDVPMGKGMDQWALLCPHCAHKTHFSRRQLDRLRSSLSGPHKPNA